jgi:hypothetical protein
MDEALKLKAEQLAGEIANQAHTLDDVNGLLRTLMKSALERMLDTEMDVYLGRKTLAALPADDDRSADASAPKNRRNGRSRKTVSGELGDLGLGFYRFSGLPARRWRGLVRVNRLQVINGPDAIRHARRPRSWTSLSPACTYC